MAITKKNIVDDIEILLTRFNLTDDSRLDEDYLSYKIDEVRAQLIRAEYRITNVLDQTWLQDLGIVPFGKVNFADDVNVNCCECDISKAFIPALISLEAGNGNQDLGLNILSSCGTKKYYPYSLSLWKDIPKEHTRSLFNYFSRIGSALYVNKAVDQLRLYGILQSPEDGVLKQSNAITSGNIQSGVVYLVKNNQIVYNSTVYAANTTFTGVTGVTAFVGVGTVYLYVQSRNIYDTDPYPVTGDMARQIVLEICSKEFGIEKMGLAADVKNDSSDDSTESKG